MAADCVAADCLAQCIGSINKPVQERGFKDEFLSLSLSLFYGVDGILCMGFYFGSVVNAKGFRLTIYKSKSIDCAFVLFECFHSAVRGLYNVVAKQ